MKYLYSIANNKIKNEKVINKYKELIEKNNFRTKNIIFLVQNNINKLEYERKIQLECSEDIKIMTYLNFVKQELIKYWPLVKENCSKIKNDISAPIFISNNLSDYIINNQVKKKRNIEGYFTDIISTDKGIANSINTNISKASLGLIDFNTIGDRLYLSKKNKDKLLRFSYSHMNEIIDYYVNELLSKSMLDNSLCIYVYNNYLLKDDIYKQHLKNNINYILVESLESCSCAEVDFIEFISNYSTEAHVYFNRTRDYSSFNNGDMEYINEKIVKEFTEMEHNNILHQITLQDLCIRNKEIELNQNSQLYSEMVEEVIEKIKLLISQNINPKDIVIISPINNNILDYQVKNKLQTYGIDVINTKKDNKIIDYPYANALVVAACIFYGYEELIKEEEYISFIETILEVNRIQAFSIYRNKENYDKYQEVITYIKNYNSKNIKIYEFLMKFYIDKMIKLRFGKLNLRTCRQIIQESEIFIENLELLKLDDNKSNEKIFIEVMKNTIKDYYIAREIQELKESNGIIITTPYAYISSNLNRKIQLWVDIGSNAWNMKIEKDISNVMVLKKSYDEKNVYTDDMEEYYKKYYLYNMIYNLLESADKVYAYKSDYTVNGYMQESILYSLLLKITYGGGKIYE